MFDVLARLSALALAALFAWSAVSKLVRRQTWISLLQRYRLGGLSPVAAWGVPVVEIAVVVLILADVATVGAAVALVALVAFSAAILRLRSIEGDRLPCGCFGQTRQRDYRVSLLRNAVLVLLALFVIAKNASIYDGFSLPDGGEIVPAALIVFGVVAAVWLGSTVARSFRKGSDL